MKRKNVVSGWRCSPTSWPRRISKLLLDGWIGFVYWWFDLCVSLTCLMIDRDWRVLAQSWTRHPHLSDAHIAERFLEQEKLTNKEKRVLELPVQILDDASYNYTSHPRKNYAKAMLRIFPFNDFAACRHVPSMRQAFVVSYPTKRLLRLRRLKTSRLCPWVLHVCAYRLSPWRDKSSILRHSFFKMSHTAF